MGQRSFALGLLILAAGTGGPLEGQLRQRAGSVEPARLERLEQWLGTLVRHTPGVRDEAFAEVGSWSNSELRSLWIEVNVVVQLIRNPGKRTFLVRPDGQRAPTEIRYTTPQLERLEALACAAGGLMTEPHCININAVASLDAGLTRLSRLAGSARLRGDSNYMLRRGALLHSDVAILMPQSGMDPVSSSPSLGPTRLRLQISDGQDVNLGQDAVHWEIARMVLDHVRPGSTDRPAPGRDAMVRQWYRATAAWMQHVDDHDHRHLERAREIFPNDPELLFLSGCQGEAYAGPRIQNAVRSADLPSGVSFSVASVRDNLRQAERFFRRALEERPDHVEARLRHGRVLGGLGRHEDAANELRQAVASTDDTLLAYYGHLFLGAEQQALGRFDASRDAYERAAELYPTAQSPLLALSALARQQGDRPAALQALQRVFDLPSARPDRIDPWWEYHVAQARNADELLQDLRRPFQSEGER